MKRKREITETDFKTVGLKLFFFANSLSTNGSCSMNRAKLESGKMISVESIWFIVFLFFAESREKQTQRIKWRPKNPSKPGKAESPFFGEKSGTQLLASFCLVGGVFLGSTPLRRHFGNLSSADLHAEMQ